jgi:DHA1 family inner membrane transport protein
MAGATVDSPSRTRIAAVAALGAMTVATFCFVTTENLPVGLLPLMAGDLHTSLSAVGLLVTGYGLTVAVVSIPLTQATRHIPRRHLLTGLLAVFVLASLASALAPNYQLLLAGRVVTALSHAVFWAVAVVTATGLFSPQVRGRVVTVVFGASSVATVLGVPAGTWLGQQSGWRAAFLALTGLGVVALVTIAALLPTTPAGEGHAAAATTPDARRYTMLLVTTALAITGLSAASTYTVPFLIQVSGFSSQAIGPLLFLRGAAGVVALAAGGVLLDRRPRTAMIAPTGLLALALFGLYGFGTSQLAVAGMLALFGAAMFMMITAMANRVLQVAPGRTDVATAANSAVFNASVAAGALIGALLLPAHGVRSTTLAAALLVAAAVAVLLFESRIAATEQVLADHRRSDQLADTDAS